MKRILLFAISACALPLASSSTARAGLIFDDSLPGATDSDGSEVTFFVIANDFVLSQTSTLESVKFWTNEGFGARQGGNPWDGTIEYFLFSDAGGGPASSAFASGDGQSIARTFLGLSSMPSLDQFQLYHYEFSIESPVLLQGGVKYWIGLHLASDFQERDEIYWSSNFPDGLGDSTRFSAGGNFDSWSFSQTNSTFQLFGSAVPSPGTLGLVALGLIGAIRSRRRFSPHRR